MGPFDETLAVVEDLDMNTRIRKAGYKLLLDPSIRFWYLPRPSLRALWRQIVTVGLVKVRILRKHPDIFKWKYVLPSLFVAALAVAVALAAGARTAGFAFLTAYALVVFGFALSRVPTVGAGALRLVLILPTLHVGYGLGFLAGVGETLLGRPLAASRRAVSDRHESHVLLAVLAERWDEAETLQRAKPVDPETFAAVCKSTDVAATVHAAMERAGRPDLLGAGVAERLAKTRAKVRVDNLLLLARLEQALDVLLAAGVRPVALKGSTFSTVSTGRSTSALWTTSTCWCHVTNVTLAIGALERAGFTARRSRSALHWFRSSFELPLTSPGPSASPSRSTGASVRRCGIAIDAAELLDARRSASTSAAARSSASTSTMPSPISSCTTSSTTSIAG